MSQRFVKRSPLPDSASEAFAWHERPGAFARLSPPWADVRLIEASDGVRDGTRTVFSVPVGPFRSTWVAEHRNYEPGRQFRDIQLRGPFAHWEHTHTILPEGESCVLEDSIDYAPPLGALGELVAGRAVRRMLDASFAYRHRITRDDLRAHRAARERGATPMRILVSGASGLIGTALVPLLTTGGHEVVRLVRRPTSEGSAEVPWDPEEGTIDAARLDGVDAVVHLAGENVGEGRWTAAKKKRIRDSRVVGTRTLAGALALMDNPPRVFVCASAIGYYGDRGEEELTESSPPGTEFLPKVCAEWEAACQPARDKGIRTVNLRTGVVLTPKGGALRKMLLPFRLCLGGVVGSGRQFWSWIALDDVIGAIHHVLTRDDISGPVNVVSPNPVRNREFTKTLGRVLGRPTVFPMPAFAARLALGEMADELLLGSNRVLPRRLDETQYEFRFRELAPALRHLLGR